MSGRGLKYLKPDGTYDPVYARQQANINYSDRKRLGIPSRPRQVKLKEGDRLCPHCGHRKLSSEFTKWANGCWHCLHEDKDYYKKKKKFEELQENAAKVD